MPNPDLEITGWPGHPDPEIRKGGGCGTVSKNFFRPLGPQFGLKIRRGPGPYPGSATENDRPGQR